MSKTEHILAVHQALRNQVDDLTRKNEILRDRIADSDMKFAEAHRESEMARIAFAAITGMREQAIAIEQREHAKLKDDHARFTEVVETIKSALEPVVAGLAMKAMEALQKHVAEQASQAPEATSKPKTKK